MKAAKSVKPAQGCYWKCAGAVGSRHLKLVMLAATALAAAAPGLAHASPIVTVPNAAYTNGVQATYAYTFPGELPLGQQSTTSPTTGLIVNGSYPPNEFWTATTDNNYNIPSLQAAVRVTGDVKATALSALVYYVEFGGAGSTVGINVKAYGDADVFANKAGAYDDTSANGASALLYVTEYQTFSEVFSIVANSDLSNFQGTHSFSLDQIYAFKTNTVYQVHMDASASADYDHSAVAQVDPYFGVPDGYTLFISDGIGNAPPNANPVPEPATLPLFASGLGALGLLCRRRKRKAAAPAVA
jgi:hypothetical protein